MIVKDIYIMGAAASNGGRTTNDQNVIGELGYASSFFNGVLSDIEIGLGKSTILTEFVKSNHTEGISDHVVIANKAVGGSTLFAGASDWSDTGTLLPDLIQEINDIKTAIISQGNTVGTINVLSLLLENDVDDLRTFAKTEQDGVNGYQYIIDTLTSEVGLDNFYISLLGDNTSGAESGHDIGRDIQYRVESEISKAQIVFTGAPDFINRTGFMSDTVHYTPELGDKAIGYEHSKFIYPRSTEYRESIYTETVVLPKTVSYNKFNGDGVNEVIGGVTAIANNGAIFTDSANSPMINQTQAFLPVKFEDYLFMAQTPIQPLGYNKFTAQLLLYLTLDYKTSQTNFLFSDAPNDKSSGITVKMQSGFEITFHDTVDQVFNTDTSNPLTSLGNFKDDNVSLVVTYDSMNLVVYVNNIEVLNTPANLNPNYEGEMYFGVDENNKGVLTSFDGYGYSHTRFTKKEVNATQVNSIFNERLTYNQANTPVTPDAPIIPEGGEDNDTNTIALIPETGLEVRLKGGDWNDTGSPYIVTYETEIRYEIGEIEFRVKEEGVNPASDITSNTIAFTESDEIDYVDVVLYSKDLDGVDTNKVYAKLIKDTVRYKDGTVLRSELKDYAAVAPGGKITIPLPSGQGYIIQFTNSAYKIQSGDVSPIGFWDLNPVSTKIRIN